MADLAPNLTPRYKATYKACGLTHQVQVRLPRGSTAVEVVSGGRVILNALSTAILSRMPTDFVWVDCHYAMTDSDIFLPDGTKPTVETGPVALSNYTAVMKATETTFKGAGGGSKCSVSIFGMYWDPSDVGGPADNGRVEAGEDSVVAAAITALNITAPITSIANFQVSMYSFATIKVNDYWLKQVRKLFP